MEQLYLYGISIDELRIFLEENLNEILPRLLKTDQTKLLTRKEAALLLRISLPTLHKWTREGRIKAYRISNKIRYKQTELERSLNEVPTLKTLTI